MGVPTTLAGGDYSARASIGLVMVEPNAGPIAAETLLHQADIAMYAAKSAGTGGLTTYSPDLVAPDNAAALHTALGAAIRWTQPAGRYQSTTGPSPS